MYKNYLLVIAVIVITVILGLSVENYFYNQRIQNINIIERSMELEKAYVEELRNLPPCKYNANIYNELFNKETRR